MCHCWCMIVGMRSLNNIQYQVLSIKRCCRYEEQRREQAQQELLAAQQKIDSHVYRNCCVTEYKGFQDQEGAVRLYGGDTDAVVMTVGSCLFSRVS